MKESVLALIEPTKELLSLDEELLINSKDFLAQNLLQAFLNEGSVAELDNFIINAAEQGASMAEFTVVLDDLKNQAFETFQELKKDYENSHIKLELIDMIYSGIETYCAVALTRFGNVLTSSTFLKIELCHPNAKIPTYAHPGDQGADIYVPEDVIIEPHTFGNMIKTGLRLEIPHGWAVAIRPRSGLSKKTTLRLSNCVGTIDENYRGEVGVLVDNIGDAPIEIKAGDRIAQLILEKNYYANFTKVEKVDDNTERGQCGFGSSDNK